jgi:hypothetical protein
VFAGESAIGPDAARFLAIEKAQSDRYVLLAFTWRKRARELMRPISACYMHAKEVQHYERG